MQRALDWPHRMVQLVRGLSQATSNRDQWVAITNAFWFPDTDISVLTPGPDGIMLRPRLTVGPHRDEMDRYGTAASYPLASWVMRTAEPVMVTNLGADYRTRWIHDHIPGAHFVVSFPIVCAGRAWGVVQVIGVGPATQALDGFENLRVLSELVGLGLAEHVKRKAAEQQVRHVMALQEVTQQLVCSEDTTTVLSLLVDIAAGIFDLDACLLLLPDEEGSYRVEAARGLEPAMIDGTFQPARFVMPQFLLSGTAVQSFTTLPIPGGKEPLGYFMAGRQAQPLLEHEITLLATWAALAGVALKSRQLQAWTVASRREAIEVSAALVQRVLNRDMRHSHNVAHLAGRLAKRVGLSDSDVHLIELASLFHEMADILDTIHSSERPTWYDRVVQFLTRTTEHWDGSGRPDGLIGEEIPIQSRILAAADFFLNLMETDGSHTNASLVGSLKGAAGSLLDPGIVAVLVQMVDQPGSLTTATDAQPQATDPVNVDMLRQLYDTDPQHPLSELTAREREILSMVALGLSNRDIAKRLYLSDATVKTHVSRILRKLSVADRTNAALLFTAHMNRSPRRNSDASSSTVRRLI